MKYLRDPYHRAKIDALPDDGELETYLRQQELLKIQSTNFSQMSQKVARDTFGISTSSNGVSTIMRKAVNAVSTLRDTLGSQV